MISEGENRQIIEYMGKRQLSLREMRCRQKHLAYWLLWNKQNPSRLLNWSRLLADASGADGMVGGQILDMEGETASLSLTELEEVHMHKTGALLSFCIEAGAILSDAQEDEIIQLRKYAKNIGLAFQIKDDILDVTSTTEQLGKTANSDAASEKSTYPSLLGLDGAQQQLEKYHREAVEKFDFLQTENSMLKLFADYIVQRNA